MMTSEITDKDREAEVAAIVLDKLSDPRNTNNGPTASVKLAVSNVSFKRSLELRNIRSKVNFLNPLIFLSNSMKLTFSC